MNVFSKLKSKLNRFKNDRVIVAVSGGVDSVVLLDIISRVFDRNNILVCHFDHGLRKESKQDAIFVKKLAAKYGVKFFLGTSRIIRNQRGNLEENSRIKRYNFLFNVAIKNNIKNVFVAHHADDQLETVMMNFERGSRARGLSGMSEASEVTYKNKKVYLLRPMLEIFKEDLRIYQKRLGLEYKEDQTNTDVKFKRNYLRKNILQGLSIYKKTSLLKLVSEVRSLAKDLDKHVLGIVSKVIVKKSDSALLLNREFLRLLSDRLMSFVIVKLISLFNGSRRDISSKNIEALRKAIKSDASGKEIILPGSLRAFIDYGTLLLLRKNVQHSILKSMTLKNGDNILKPLGINLFVGISKKNLKKDILFDKDKLSLPLKVRPFINGQRISIARVGSKKIQDLFVDEKVERRFRKNVPILLDSKNRVLAVLDLRKSDICNPDSKTVQYLFIDIKKI